MNRRELLSLGSLPIIAFLVGCVSTAGGSPITITRTGDVPVEKRTTEFVGKYPNEKPIAEIVVGKNSEDFDRPYGMRVFNESATERRVSLTAETGPQNRLVVACEGTVPADGYFSVVAWRPSQYTVTVTADGEGDDPRETFEISEDAWYGGSLPYPQRRHHVTVHRDGIEIDAIALK